MASNDDGQILDVRRIHCVGVIANVNQTYSGAQFRCSCRGKKTNLSITSHLPATALQTSFAQEMVAGKSFPRGLSRAKTREHHRPKPLHALLLMPGSYRSTGPLIIKPGTTCCIV